MARRKKQIAEEPVAAPLPIQPRQHGAAAKLWLWAGVGAVTLIILILWGWAFSIRLASFSWEKTPEGSLIKRSQTDWDALFNTEEEKIKNQEFKSQLKNILTQIAVETSTTTANTSTVNSSATTTSN